MFLIPALLRFHKLDVILILSNLKNGRSINAMPMIPAPEMYRIKTIGDAGEGRVGGYLVVFGDKKTKDLEGEYFTSKSELGLDWYDRRPVLFHHGMDGQVKSAVIGVIDLLKADNIGVWAEAQLDMRQRYVRAVQKLVNDGVLNWSSGSLPHLVQVESDGFIKMWPIVEGSLTPTPAEPRRTNVQSLSKAMKGLDNEGMKRLNLSGYAKHDALKELGIVIEAPAPDDTEIDEDVPSTEGDETTDDALDLTGLLQSVIEAPETETPATTDTPVTPVDRPSEDGNGTDETTETDDLDEPDQTEGEDNSIMENLDAVITAIAQALGIELDEEQMTTLRDQVESMLSEAMPEGEEAGKATSVKSITTAMKDAKFRSKVINAVKGTGAQLAPVLDLIRADVEGMRGSGGKSQLMGGQDLTPNKSPSAYGNIVLKSKFERANLDARDVALIYAVKRVTDKNYQPTNEMMRFMTGNALEMLKKGELELNLEDDHSGIKATRFLNQLKSDHEAHRAMKNDELAHTTNTGYGDDYIATLWSNELWRTERPENVVAPEFRPVDMPSNPFKLPVEGVDPVMRYVPETTNESQLTNTSGNPITISKIGSDNIVITASKLGMRVAISAELEEDAIIAVISEQRRQMLEVADNTIDSVILNADASTTGNVNLDGGTPAVDAPYMFNAGDGLIKAAIDSGKVIDAGGVPTLAMFRAMRRQLDRVLHRKFNDLVYFIDSESELKVLDIPEFLTVDKMGPNATVLNGQIGSIDRIPVLVSDQILPSASNGKVSSTAGNNVKGRALLVYKPYHRTGYRRRISITGQFYGEYDAHIMFLNLRFGMVNRSGNYVSLLRNITVQ